MSDTAIVLSTLVGETITDLSGMDVGSEEVNISTASGRKFRMYHDQECCESVALNEVIGEVADLIGSPITKAEESTNSANLPEYSDSWTWTFYHFATVKGYVTLRWFGESNGYYGEGVDFDEVQP